MAQDRCAEEDANIFFPESMDELYWVESLMDASTNQKMFLGYKGFDTWSRRTFVHMDNSEHVGIRGITSKSQQLPIISNNVLALW